MELIIVSKRMIALRIGLLLALGLTLALAEEEVIKCPGGECVKLHLCRDGSIVTDGSFLIDIRFNEDDPCEHYLLKCCAIPDGEDGAIVVPPSTGEAEFIVPPSSGTQSENQIGSNSGSTESTVSVVPPGPSGGHPSDHGRDQEGVIANPGNYHGGSYSQGGSSFSGTYSESHSSSNSYSSTSNQNYQQQWTGPQVPIGMGGSGGGYNIGGYGTVHPGIKGQGSGQTIAVNHGAAQGGYGSNQYSGQTGQGTVELGSLGQGGRQPGSSGHGSNLIAGNSHGGASGSSGTHTDCPCAQGQTSGNQVENIGSNNLSGGQSGVYQVGGSGQSGAGSQVGQSGSLGYNPGIKGQESVVTGPIGHGVVHGAHGSSQGTGQTGQGTVELGSSGTSGSSVTNTGGHNLQGQISGHQVENIGSNNASGGQSGAYHVGGSGQLGAGSQVAQPGSLGSGVKEQGSGQTGSIGHGAAHGAHGSSQGTGQTGQGTVELESLGQGGRQPGSTGHGSNLIAGDLHSGTSGSSVTHPGGNYLQGQTSGHQVQNIGSNNASGGQSGAYQVDGSGQLGVGSQVAQPGSLGSGVKEQGSGQTGSIGHGATHGTHGTSQGTGQTGQGTVELASLVQGGRQPGSTGHGSNLIAGDLHSGTSGSSVTHPGGNYLQGQTSGHQVENIGSNNASGGQSGAYQVYGSGQLGDGSQVAQPGSLGYNPGVKEQGLGQTGPIGHGAAGAYGSSQGTGQTGLNNVSDGQSGAQQVDGSGQPGAGNAIPGTTNIIASIGTVTKEQTVHTSTGSIGSNNIGALSQEQTLNHGQKHVNSGANVVKHYEGDGCTSHTQKHTTIHTQHPGYNSGPYAGTTVSPILPPRENMGCGFRNPDGVGFRITGGEDGEAEYGEFPWMVAILKEEKALDQVINVYQCGGSLIHPRVILTAAHCVQNKKPHEIKVRLGEWDTQTTNEIHDHQDRNVAEIVVHDKFYKGGLFNDFALLFLDKPAEIIDTINTVCLPPQDFNFDLSRCFASGWGKDVFGKEGKYQVILKKIDLPIMPFNKCQDALRTTRLGKRFILNKSFICAGGEPKKDTCKGDGGSPLVCPIPGSPNRFYQAGIVAWGIGCGEHGIPGVYANVAGFRTWIDEQLTQRSIPHNYYIAV